MDTKKTEIDFDCFIVKCVECRERRNCLFAAMTTSPNASNAVRRTPSAKERLKYMTGGERETLQEKGVLEYETMIALREQTKRLMSELSGLQSKLTDVPVDTENEGEILLAAVKTLNGIEKKLRAEIEIFRQKNWIDEKEKQNA